MAMAVYGLGIIFAPLIGRTVGGSFTHSHSWCWVFYINIPVSIAAVLMFRILVGDPTLCSPGR